MNKFDINRIITIFDREANLYSGSLFMGLILLGGFVVISAFVMILYHFGLFGILIPVVIWLAYSGYMVGTGRDQ